MPWYRITYENEETLSHYPSLEAAYFDYYCQQKWSVNIVFLKISPLKSKALSCFLLEVLKGLEAELSLQDILAYMARYQEKSQLALIAQAIRDEMQRGVSFNISFKRLVTPSLQGYCELFIQDSTAEYLREHLVILQQQISQLRSWLKRLQTSLIYPFFVIQLALLIWISSIWMQNKSAVLTSPLAIYLAVSSAQLGIYRVFQSSVILKIIENTIVDFRLNKLFTLLIASLKAGAHLQNALTILPTNFSNMSIKKELFLVYYHLRIGDTYVESFPTYWFPRESLLALRASCHSGDIIRALTTASSIHNHNWMTKLKWLEKICPLIGLMIAAIFVGQTLITLYLPIINLN